MKSVTYKLSKWTNNKNTVGRSFTSSSVDFMDYFKPSKVSTSSKNYLLVHHVLLNVLKNTSSNIKPVKETKEI